MKRLCIPRLLSTAALGVLAVLSTGCGSVPGRFDNRILVSLTEDRAFTGVLFGSIGFTLEHSADDARELKRLRERAAASTTTERTAP